MNLPPILNWEKVASVTHGGKRYFFVAFHMIPGGRKVKYSVVWNRRARMWVAEFDNMRCMLVADELGTFNDPQSAKTCAENHAIHARGVQI